jgi:hypothetical protein
MTLRSNPVLFYSGDCGHCVKVIPGIVEHFLKEGIHIVVRKPSTIEVKRIPGVPALFIPPDIYGDRPILMVGSEILTWLEELTTQLHGHSINSDD